MKQIDFTKANFTEIINWLQKGNVAVTPTDTIPGFAADAEDTSALQKIADLKQRPTTKPFLLLVPDFLAAEKLCHFSSVARRLVKAFWPGGLTLLLPRKYGILPKFFPQEYKLAVRVPGDPQLIKFLFTFGKPLVSTSVNLAGKRSITDAATIADHLKNTDVLIAESKNEQDLQPSTIVEIDENTVIILREGCILEHEIKRLQDNFSE